MDGIVKGQRINLLPKVLNLKTGEYDYVLLYDAQSCFSEAYDKIRDYGRKADKDSLPDSLYQMIFGENEKASEDERREIIDYRSR